MSYFINFVPVMQTTKIVFATLSVTICATSLSATEYLAKQAHNRGGILQIEFSNDGKQLITTATGSTVNVWDLPNHKLIRSFQMFRGNWIGFPTFLPDSKSFLITAQGRGRPRMGWELQQCDIATGKVSVISKSNVSEWPVAIVNENRIVTQAIIDPSVDPSGELRYQLKIIDLKTKEQRVYPWDSLFEVLAFSRSKKFAGLLFGKALVRIVNLQTGKVVYEFHLDVQQSGHGFAFYPDESGFIAVSFSQNEKVFFGDLNKKTITSQEPLNFRSFSVGDVSSDGRLFALMVGKKILFWDAKAQQVLHLTELNPIRWSVIKISPDGKSCVAGDYEGNLKIYSVPSFDKKEAK